MSAGRVAIRSRISSRRGSRRSSHCSSRSRGAALDMQYSSCHFLVRSYYINGNSSQLPVPTAIFGSAVEHFQDSRPGNLGLRLERPFLIKLLLADWPDYLRGTLSSRRSLEQNLVRSSKLELPRFSLEDLLFYSVTL